MVNSILRKKPHDTIPLTSVSKVRTLANLILLLMSELVSAPGLDAYWLDTICSGPIYVKLQLYIHLHKTGSAYIAQLDISRNFIF